VITGETKTEQETIQYLWDVIDKIHAAADDARLGVPGADPARIVEYVERQARAALMTVKRPPSRRAYV
jgi:hypothetical protein